MAFEDYDPPFALRDHQVKALEHIHNRCVLKGGVGSGKTYTALVYYMRNEAPKDLYVITTARKRNELDWQADAAKMAIGTTRDSTIAGVITVDSWQNVVKYKEVEGQFFIFDEQKLVGSGSWVKAFLKIARRNNWIMLSATPGDNWMDYAPVFIANGFYKNRTDFIRKHVVYNHYSKYPKIDRYVGTATLAKYRKAVVVDMPFERSTVRHILKTPVNYSEYLYERIWKDRWHIWEERPIKDASELFIQIRKVVNIDPSRANKILELMEKHDRLIIFYNFDYELEILREIGEKTGRTTAEWNGKRHQTTPNDTKWLYLVNVKAGAEAWNCIETDAMIFYSLQYSNKIYEQCQGRIDRLNTPFVDLYYYILMSEAPIDKMIYRSLMEKKDFNEKEFLVKNA